jgi:glycosyltransferase involved in cell wall biosynthesis
MRYRLGILDTHPIQYHAPWYRALARIVDLHVFYCHRQANTDHARTGFGMAFEWDVPLLEGYDYRFLTNCARRPDVSNFAGCNTPEIVDIIRRDRFDAFMVHGWSTYSFWQAMFACWQTSTPLFVRGDSQLVTRRSLAKRLFKRVVYGLFIPRFDAYLVVGERARQYYLHYGATPCRMFYSPHAVDNLFFADHANHLRPEREKWREQWLVPPGATVLLFAGKFTPIKRPIDFVQALSLCKQQGANIWGLMAGDGSLRGEVETMIEQLQAPITLVGFLNQSEMPRAYTASDMLVLLSDSETWGLVVNEAMASGLPAIISDTVGCGQDLVIPGQTGEVFRCGAVEELAQIIMHLSEAPETILTMGVNARRHIERYSIPVAVDGVLAALNTSTGCHSPPLPVIRSPHD